MSEMTVPDGWGSSTISDFVSVGRGFAFKSKDYENKGNPIVRVTNISNSNKLDLSSDVVFLNEERSEEFKQYILRENDFLLVMVGATVGKHAEVRLSGQKLFLNQNMWCLRVKNESSNSQRFAIYGLQKVVNDFLRTMQGSAREFLTQKDFGTAEILVPPLPEQQKIASILTSVDDVIEKTQSQINKLQDLKKGTMNELLTRGIGHTEFVDSPVGKIPRGWELKTIGQVAKLQGGYAFKSSDAQEEGARWLKIANVGVGKINWKDKSYLPEFFAEQHKDFVLQSGDVVIALTRPVLSHKLKIARLTNEDSGALLNQRVGRLISKSDIEENYLYYLLQTDNSVGVIERIIFGSDPPNISGQQIESIPIAIPTKDERDSFLQVLVSIDKNIEKKQRKLEQTKSLKKSLMQDLLTGKVRVPLQ